MACFLSDTNSDFSSLIPKILTRCVRARNGMFMLSYNRTALRIRDTKRKNKDLEYNQLKAMVVYILRSQGCDLNGMYMFAIFTIVAILSCA